MNLLRPLALVAASLALASCGHLSAILPTPERCPPELTALIPPIPGVSAGAGVPQPLTDAERAAFDAWGNDLGLKGADAREKDRRLRAGQDWCAKRKT